MTSPDQRLRRLADSAPVAMFEGDAEGGVVWANARWREVTGVTSRRGRRDRWLSSVHPQDREGLLMAWREVISTGAEVHARVRFVQGSSVRTVEARLAPLRDGRGRVVGVTGTLEPSEVASASTDAPASATDLAARGGAGDRFQRLSEAAPVGVFGLSPDGDVTFVNDRACELMGRTREDVLAGGWGPAIHPDDRPAVVAAWEENRRTGREHRIEHRFLTPDGRIVWVLAAATPIRDGDGRLEGYVGTVTDLTAQKDAEEALRTSEELFRTLSAQAPVGIVRFDAAGAAIWANARWEEITGRSIEDVVERRLRVVDVFHPEERDEIAREWSAWVTRDVGEEVTHEQRVVRPDGEVRWVSGTAVASRNASGAVTGRLIALTDITELKAAEEALRASEAYLSRAQEFSGVSVWDLVLPDGGPLVFDGLHDLTGLAPGTEPLSQTLVANVHPQDRDRLAATLEKAAWSGEPFELTCRLHRSDDGCERVVRVGGRAERPGRLLGTVIDVTDQVESERRLARAQEIAHLGSWDWNIATGDLSWSDEIYRIFGLEPQQFTPSYGTFLERVHPDDRAALEQAVADAIETRTPYRIEHRVVRPDGEERIVHEQGEVTYAPDGTPLHMIGAVLDITERKRAEVALDRFKRTLDLTLDCVFMFRPDTLLFFYVNRGAVDQVGYSLDELMRMHPYDITPEFPEERFRELVAPLVDGERDSITFETVHRHKRGHEVPVEVFLQHVAPDGEEPRFLAIVRDVTVRRQAEEALRESRAHLARAQEIAGVGVWDLESETGRVRVSDNIYEMTGLAPDTEPLLPALIATVHPEDRDRLKATFEEAARRSERIEVTYRIHHARTGDERVLRINTEPLDSGRLLGTVIDLTDQVEFERRLARVQEIAHLGSWDWDVTSGEVSWSAETYRILGLAPGQIEASYAAYLERVHPDDRAIVEESVSAALATRVRFRNEHRVVRPDGQERIVMGQGHVICAPDGTPIRIIGSLLDVTERALAEKALRRSEERFRRLADHAPVGIYETDADGACRWVNELWCRIVGISAADALGAGWVAAIHPEDREDVLSAWRQAVRAGEPFVCEFRLRSTDGRISWVTGRAIALTDPSGAVTGYLGTITDVTERARAEREQSALRRVATAVASDAPSRSIFALVAEQVADVLGVPTCSVVQFDAAEQVALVVGGWSERQGVASPGARLSLDDGRVLTRVFRAGQAVRSEDPLDLGDVTGETHEPGADVVSVTAAPVWMGRDLWGAIAVAGMGAPLPADTDDRLERFCELVGLALANADARRQLAALASTDHLTGLPNRRSFQERLAAEVERARKRDRPLALVVFDIDHFKEINDGRGHETGDRVLIEFSHRFAALARSGEVVARIGGEEFAWILPETDAMGALAAAQRARQRIAAEPFPTVGTVTVSGGVCDLEQASSASELFRFADVALYWAKGQGRNAVFRYSPEVVELLSAEEQQRRMRRAQALSGVRALANAVDAKDPATQRHSERVAELAEILALASGWTPERAAHMREAALVHDVGKIGVRDSVLSNPGRLSEEEYAEVQQHVILGARMVEGLLDDEQVAWLRHHHERWDGRGYPDRLAGSEIPEGARILALADAWDAMTTPRPYGPSMTIGEGMREMQRLSGVQFDPALVESLGRLWARGDLALSEHDVELST